MYNFLFNEEIEKIFDKSANKVLAVKAVEYVNTLVKAEGLVIEDYRWQMLVNHVSAMVDRSVTGEIIEDIDPLLFGEISEESLNMAKGTVDFIGNLKEDEKYLLSVHFESLKIIQEG